MIEMVKKPKIFHCKQVLNRSKFKFGQNEDQELKHIK